MTCSTGSGLRLLMAITIVYDIRHKHCAVSRGGIEMSKEAGSKQSNGECKSTASFVG